MNLSGERIHPWARIASVAINFVARVTQRRYRNSLVGYEAMKQLIKDQGLRFDPVAVKDFVRSLGLNPPGSILLLSDGSIARVVEMVEGNLLRPREGTHRRAGQRVPRRPRPAARSQRYAQDLYRPARQFPGRTRSP